MNVTVFVQRGEGFASDLFSYVNAFVQLTVGHKRCRTTVQCTRKSGSAEWNETFQFTTQLDSILRIDVIDRSAFGDRTLGQDTILLSTLVSGSPCHHTVSLGRRTHVILELESSNLVVVDPGSSESNSFDGVAALIERQQPRMTPRAPNSNSNQQTQNIRPNPKSSPPTRSGKTGGPFGAYFSRQANRTPTSSPGSNNQSLSSLPSSPSPQLSNTPSPNNSTPSPPHVSGNGSSSCPAALGTSPLSFSESPPTTAVLSSSAPSDFNCFDTYLTQNPSTARSRRSQQTQGEAPRSRRNSVGHTVAPPVERGRTVPSVQSRGVTQRIIDSCSWTFAFEACDESDSCAICLSYFRAGEAGRCLRCLHTFHTSCIDRWLASNRRCPYCKTEITAMFQMPRQGAFEAKEPTQRQDRTRSPSPSSPKTPNPPLRASETQFNSPNVMTSPNRPTTPTQLTQISPQRTQQQLPRSHLSATWPQGGATPHVIGPTSAVRSPLPKYHGGSTLF